MYRRCTKQVVYTQHDFREAVMVSTWVQQIIYMRYYLGCIRQHVDVKDIWSAWIISWIHEITHRKFHFKIIIVLERKRRQDPVMDKLYLLKRSCETTHGRETFQNQIVIIAGSSWHISHTMTLRQAVFVQMSTEIHHRVEKGAPITSECLWPSNTNPRCYRVETERRRSTSTACCSCCLIVWGRKWPSTSIWRPWKR